MAPTLPRDPRRCGRLRRLQGRRRRRPDGRPQGDLRFLIGPNGAGKTTLVDVDHRAGQAATGSIAFGGQDLLGETGAPDRRLGSRAHLPDRRPSSRTLTVLQNLDIAAACRPAAADACCADARAHLPRRSTETLETIGLAAQADQPAGVLATARSSGWRSACCWCRTPELLLLDEPVAGMSHEEREATGELLGSIGCRPHRRRHRARHGLPASLRPSVTVLHARPGAQRGHGRRGAGEPEGAGGLPGPPQRARRVPPGDRPGRQRDAATAGRAYRIRAHRGAARRQRRRCRPTAWRRCSATTAPARPRCCAPRSACSGRSAGTVVLDGEDVTESWRRTSGSPGDGLRAAGSAVLPAPDHRGEPAAGRRRPSERQGGHRRGAGPVPGAAGTARAAAPGCCRAVSASSWPSPGR